MTLCCCASAMLVVSAENAPRVASARKTPARTMHRPIKARRRKKADRALRFLFIDTSYGRGAGVGRDLGLGRERGVGVALGVVVGVAVGVAVTLGVAVGVRVGVGVGVPQGISVYCWLSLVGGPGAEL